MSSLLLLVVGVAGSCFLSLAGSSWGEQFVGANVWRPENGVSSLGLSLVYVCGNTGRLGDCGSWRGLKGLARSHRHTHKYTHTNTHTLAHTYCYSGTLSVCRADSQGHAEM